MKQNVLKHKLTQAIKYIHVAATLGATNLVFAADTAGTAQDIAMINNLGATVKQLLEGQGALVIDGIILAAAAYGTAVTKSPAPIVCGIVSCGVFHVATKLILN